MPTSGDMSYEVWRVAYSTEWWNEERNFDSDGRKERGVPRPGAVRVGRWAGVGEGAHAGVKGEIGIAMHRKQRAAKGSLRPPNRPRQTIRQPLEYRIPLGPPPLVKLFWHTDILGTRKQRSYLRRGKKRQSQAKGHSND